MTSAACTGWRAAEGRLEILLSTKCLAPGHSAVPPPTTQTLLERTRQTAGGSGVTASELVAGFGVGAINSRAPERCGGGILSLPFCFSE